MLSTVEKKKYQGQDNVNITYLIIWHSLHGFPLLTTLEVTGEPEAILAPAPVCFARVFV